MFYVKDIVDGSWLPIAEEGVYRVTERAEETITLEGDGSQGYMGAALWGNMHQFDGGNMLLINRSNFMEK